MSVQVFTYDQLREVYEGMTSEAVAECTFTTPLVGGISPDKKGIETFVKYQLHLGGEEAKKEVERISRQEVAYDSRTDPSAQEGELDETLTSGVRVIRRDERGPWLGNWMIHACLKAAASRTQLFTKQRGSKGDFIELGEVRSVKFSKGANAQRVYLDDGKGKAAKTEFKQFKGRVTQPGGSASIIQDCETTTDGARFAFAFRYKPTKISKESIVRVFAAAMVIGLGSCKSFGHGKFRVDTLTVTEPDRGKGSKAAGH